MAKFVQALLEDFRWDVFGHPAHSPDLAPSDYYLFLCLNSHLGSTRFSSDAEVKKAVHEFFQKLDGSVCATGIAKLVHRYDKCLNLLGSYVGK